MLHLTRRLTGFGFVNRAVCSGSMRCLCNRKNANKLRRKIRGDLTVPRDCQDCGNYSPFERNNPSPRHIPVGNWSFFVRNPSPLLLT